MIKRDANAISKKTRHEDEFIVKETLTDLLSEKKFGKNSKD